MSLIELGAKEWLDKRSEFEVIIDARSPKEFAYSHILGARNFYALDDAQHEQIGTIYKTDRARAKALGASYICGNLQNVINKVYGLAKVGSLIGIYCARGGMRSQALATVLGMIGYRVLRLEGGYKAFRVHVLSAFAAPVQTKFITLFGNTGCYKSKLIRALSPALDLEKAANHLGSVFGAIAGAQPSQKAFEDELFFELERLRGETAFAEGESRRIGALTLPASLHEALRAGVCVEVTASINRRVECTMSDYKRVDSAFFYECMRKISPFISREVSEDAVRAFELGDTAKVAEILLVKYYDKVYKKPVRIDVSVSSDDFEAAIARLNEIRRAQITSAKF